MLLLNPQACMYVNHYKKYLPLAEEKEEEEEEEEKEEKGSEEDFGVESEVMIGLIGRLI